MLHWSKLSYLFRPKEDGKQYDQDFLKLHVVLFFDIRVLVFVTVLRRQEHPWSHLGIFTPSLWMCFLWELGQRSDKGHFLCAINLGCTRLSRQSYHQEKMRHHLHAIVVVVGTVFSSRSTSLSLNKMPQTERVPVFPERKKCATTGLRLKIPDFETDQSFSNKTAVLVKNQEE